MKAYAIFNPKGVENGGTIWRFKDGFTRDLWVRTMNGHAYAKLIAKGITYKTAIKIIGKKNFEKKVINYEKPF